MKLGPVTKLDEKNKIISKKLTMTLCRKAVTSLQFFQFMANFGQSERRILGEKSVKLIFSVIFYLTINENRTKKSLKPLTHYWFE